MNAATIWKRHGAWVLACNVALVMSACGDDSGPSPGVGTGGTQSTGGSAGTGGSTAPGGSGGATASGGSGGTGGAGGSNGGTDAGFDAGVDSGTPTSPDAGDAGGPVNSTDAGDANAPAPVSFTAQEWRVIQTLSPLPALPDDTTNQYAQSAAAATLGQMLYKDPSYAGALVAGTPYGAQGDVGKIACDTCHKQSYLDDSPGTVGIGAGGALARNVPTVINASFYTWTNWGGRFSRQWELPLAVAETAKNMNSTRLDVVHLIYDKYKAEYEAMVGAAMDAGIASYPPSGKPGQASWDTDITDPAAQYYPWGAAQRDVANRVFVNYGKAIAAYLRKLVSRNAPFDNFVAGNATAITEEAKRGLQLFVGEARCATCHSGPTLSDNKFHNLGVVPSSDRGRYGDIPPLLASAFNSASTTYSDDPTAGQRQLQGLTNPPALETDGAFRTPGLRGVDTTGPYMHAGQVASLSAVIDFYDVGGGTPTVGTLDPLMVSLGLTAQDKAALVAFLGTLRGDAIPSALTADTHK